MDFIGNIIDNIIGDKNVNSSRQTHIKRSPRNEVNIYSSNNIGKSRNNIKRRATKMNRSRTNESEDSDSIYSDEDDNKTAHTIESMAGNTNPTFFMDQQNNILDNRKYERKTVEKVKTRNAFASQFDPLELDTFSDPSSFNAVHNSTGTNSAIKRQETERALAYDGGYSNFEKEEDGTYDVVNPKKFDMNLVPFFRSRGGNQEYNRGDLHQRKMEAFTGSTNNPAWQSKKESSPLFSPVVGATNIYGNSVPSDEFEGRYIPSKERRYELPFTQVRQAPGLGLGTNEESSHGFHDNYRVDPVSTDTIRGPRGPKVSYTAPIIMGTKGSKGSVIGIQENRKPPTYTDFGTERITGVGGYGYIKAPTVRNVYNPDNMATQNRGVDDHQRYNPAGGSGNNKVMPDNLRGNFKTPSKENYLEAEPRAITLIEGMQARPSETPYVPDPTKRMQHNYSYLGPGGREGIGYGHTFNMVTNIPDPTKRDQHNSSGRNGTGIKVNGSRHTNTYDAPDPTRRDQHNSIGRTGTGIKVNGSQYTNTYDTPDPTRRDQHNSTGRTGTGIKVNGSQYTNTYDAPDPTRRDQHNSTGRTGTGIKVNGSRHTNTYDAPDPTKRDQHNSSGRTGTGIKVNGSQYTNTYDAPDPTRRDQHNSIGRTGTGIKVNGSRHTNTYDAPDPTKRDQHNSTGRTGTGIKVNGSQYTNTYDAPDPTRRDQHNSIGRTGTGITSREKHYINTYDAPDPTKRDQHNSSRSSGGSNGKEKHYINTYDAPDPTKRDQHNSSRSSGGANGKEKHYINTYDAPDPTKRDQHNSSRSSGGADGNEKHYVNTYDAPDLTKRDQHNSSRSSGGAAQSDKQYTFNYIDNIPDPTMRDIHGKNNYINPAKNEVEGQRSRRDANTMSQNVSREKTLVRRNPTQSNYDKGPTFEFTKVELKDPIQMYENRQPIKGATFSTDRFVPGSSLNRNETYYVNDRKQFVKETLNGNPYVNNLLHKAIPK